MTDYETRLISLNKETTYNADDWILLENDVMKDNSDLIKKIFGGGSENQFPFQSTEKPCNSND